MSLRDLDLLKVFMENHGGFPDQRRFIAGKSIELNVLDLQFVDDFFMRIGYNGISWDIMGYCGCYRQKQSYETLPSSLQTWQWTIHSPFLEDFCHGKPAFSSWISPRLPWK